MKTGAVNGWVVGAVLGGEREQSSHALGTVLGSEFYSKCDGKSLMGCKYANVM